MHLSSVAICTGAVSSAAGIVRATARGFAPDGAAAERARVLGARGDQTNFAESSPLKENSGTFTKDKTLEDLFTYGLNDI